MKQPIVIKSSGEEELFSWKSIYDSARGVGATREIAVEIADQIKLEITGRIDTAKIRRRVSQMLKKRDLGSAMRFNLPEAMRRLGPTGFPFENYVGRIFESQGFQVRIGARIRGYCVGHEVDFLAWNKELLYLGECKYHNRRGIKVDLPTTLLYAARFNDLEKGNFTQKKIKAGRRVKSILVTNTEFTQEAIKYFNCIGKSLWGWKYPARRGIERMIDEEGIYPITILPSLSSSHLIDLFCQRKMMLAKDVLESDHRELMIKKDLFDKIQTEAKILFGLQDN